MLTSGLPFTCYGHEDWSCRGDGTADRDLIFVGQPSDVSQALNRLTYQSTYSFTTDILTIHIADGSRSPITGFSNGHDIETEVDSILDCLDGVDFITESFRGIESPICFRSALNLTIKVGRVAGSEDVVAEEDISKNRQLSISGIVFGLMICLCILRVFASKICGWKLVAIPSEWSDDDDTDSVGVWDGETFENLNNNTTIIDGESATPLTHRANIFSNVHSHGRREVISIKYDPFSV